MDHAFHKRPWEFVCHLDEGIYRGEEFTGLKRGGWACSSCRFMSAYFSLIEQLAIEVLECRWLYAPVYLTNHLASSQTAQGGHDRDVPWTCKVQRVGIRSDTRPGRHSVRHPEDSCPKGEAIMIH